MRRRHASLIIVAILIAAGGPPSRGPAGFSVRLLGAQAAASCCIPLPVVATSKEPAKGQVDRELGFGDLEQIFSNRHLAFDGGWDDGFVALTYEIDRTGKYKMREKPAPKVVRQVPIIEASFVDSLLHPAPLEQMQRQRMAPPLKSGESRWARTTSADTANIFLALIQTLARTNKYGEPAAGLRAASLSAARFLLDGLAAVPMDLAQSGGVDQQIWYTGSLAQQGLYNLLGRVRPSSVARTGGNESRTPTPGELPLTDFDRANALFDVFRSADENGRESGLYTIREYMTVDARFVFELVEVASARAEFGGPAAPGSAYDSVACRAFSLLVELAHGTTKNAQRLRDELLDMYTQSYVDVGNPRRNVVRTALIMTGVESAQDAQRLVDALFQLAMTASDHPEGLTDIVRLMATLMQKAGGDRDTYRKEISSAITERIADMRKRNEGFRPGETRTPPEIKFLEAWDAGAKNAQLSTTEKACAVDAAETKGRIILYAVTVDGLQVIDELYVGVSTVVEVQFDNDRGTPDVTIELSIGGAVTKLTAKRYDEAGRIYRAEPILPGGQAAK